MEVYQYNPTATPPLDLNNVLASILAGSQPTLNGQPVSYYSLSNFKWKNLTTLSLTYQVQAFRFNESGAQDFQNGQLVEGIPVTIKSSYGTWYKSAPGVNLIGNLNLMSDASGMVNIRLAVQGPSGAYGVLCIEVGLENYVLFFTIE